MIADIGIAVRTILNASPDVTAITQRFYSDHLPQGMKVPAVVMWSITSQAYDCLGGPTGFEQTQMQIECHGTTRGEANQLWGAVNRALAGYRGVVNILNGEDVVIRGIGQSTGHSHREDRPESGTDQYRYVTMQDFDIPYHVFERA